MTLLMCHLFSTGGYVAFYQYLKYRSDVFFDEQTSKNQYNLGDLVEVAIPVEMPNVSDWAGYEKVSGSVRFEEASYNYVKMKMTRHAIYLMCVPNYKTTTFLATNVIEAKGIKDIPVPKKDHVPFLKLNFTEKAQFHFFQFAFNIPVRYIKTVTQQPIADLLSNTLRIPEQPPRVNC